MRLRLVGTLGCLAVLVGCGGSRIQTFCDRACVTGERCDRPTKRCVQNEAPVITLITPDRGALIGTPEVLVTGTVIDDAEIIKSADVSLDQGGTWFELGVGEGGRFEKRIPVPVQDGSLSELRVRASDEDGLEGSLSVPMTFDRVAPVCRIVAPLEGATVSGSTATFRVEASDASARFGLGTLQLAAGIRLQKPIEGGLVSWEAPLPAVDGQTQQWSFQGAAAAGNLCQVARDLRIDTVGPVVTLNAPLNGASVTRNSSGGVPVRFTVADASAVQRAEVQAPPSTLWQPATLNGQTGEFDWQVPVNDQGVQRTVKVRAVDAFGNTGAEATVTVSVDTVPPTCTLIAPTAGQVLSQSSGPVFQVRWSVQDGSGSLGGSEVSLDDGMTWLPVGIDATGVAAYPWMLDSTANGVMTTLRVRGADAAGNRCPERTVQVTVDTVGPVIAVTAPTQSSSLSSPTVAFRGTATDGARAATSVSLDFADGVGPRISALSGNQWAVSVPTSATEDFVAHAVVIRATDVAGNSTTLPWPVRVDRVLPTLALPQPTEGQILNAAAFTAGDDVSVAVQSSDGDPFLMTEFRLGSGSFSTLSTGQVAVATTSADDDVEYVATARARDSAGNTVTVTRRFRVDRRAPTLTITSPVMDASLNAASLVFNGTTDVRAPTLTLDFDDGTGPRAVSPAGGTWSLTVPTVSTEDFVRHAVVVRAVDAAGNVTTSTRPLRVDRVAPRLTIPSPAEGQLLNGGPSNPSTVAVNVQTVDGDPSVAAEVETTPGAFSPVTAGTITVTTQATDNDVAYSRTVRARDLAGNVTTLTRTFRMDRVAPTVTLTTPAAGAALNGSAVSFTGTASDGSNSLATLTLDFADGVGARAISTAAPNWSLAVPTSATEDFVAHAVVVRGVDPAGNATTVNRTIRVDRVAPVLNVTAPTEGQRFNATQVGPGGTVTVAAQATDGDPANVVEAFTGGAWSATGTVPVSTAPTDDNVEYAQQLRARDTAGNVTAVTRRFRVDRVAPTVTTTSPTNGQSATPLEFALQFSETMTLASGLPATFVPAEPGAATVALDGSRRIATVAGLTGNTTYVATLRPAGIADDFGNPPVPAAAVTFTTAPRRPSNGAVLIDATTTRRVEFFRVSADEDGVLAVVARVINPQNSQHSWLFGWIDPVTGQFLQQGSAVAGTTGAFITSVSEPTSGGARRRRASVRLGLAGSSVVFELGVPGIQTFSAGMTFAVNAGTTELTGTEVATLSQVGGDLQYSRPPNPLTSLDSNLSGPLSPMAVSVFDRNQWLVVARSPTAFAYLWRSCSASGCTTSLPSFFGSIPPGYLVDWDRLSFVHLNGITWGCGQNFADSSDTFCMTPSGGFGDFVGGRIATHVRSGPTSIDLAWVPNTGNTVVDSTMPTVRVARITGCAPGEPSSFSTFSLTNAFGTQTNSIGLALPEFSPVPGPTPALLWLEAPGRLRYVQ